MDDMHYPFMQAKRLHRRTFMQHTLAAGLSFGGIAAALQACGGAGASGGSGGSSGPAAIKWGAWANPGELTRFQAFTSKYNTDHKASARFIPINDDNYSAKILTEINAGTAPDLFYASDGMIAKFIQNQTIYELTPFLNSSKSAEKVEDYNPGLWGSVKTKSGKIFGVPVDCNPFVIWYNKKVLQDAGVTDDPADLSSQGKWTRDAFIAMVEKVRAKGKYGYILDDSTNHFWNWVTTHDGKVYDDNGYGNFIVADDPNAVEILSWLVENVRSKVITMDATLPKGQGDDLAFMANQVAFTAAGRWTLPEYKQTPGLQYDIVPWPSKSGKIAPANIPIAYLVMNKQSKNPEAAFDFLTNFVSRDGQTFRLQGGGNAVPSISGPDQVVLDGTNPAHAQTFLDARNVGYAMFPAQMGTPALGTDIGKLLDPVWLQGGDLKTALGKVAEMANPRIQKAIATLLQ